MLKFVFFCLMFMGIGVIAIWRGKNAIRNRYMANSLKSSLVTGIKEIKGQTAVTMGKVSVIIGVVICSLSGLVLLVGTGFFLLGMMLDRSPSVADMQSEAEARRYQAQMESQSRRKSLSSEQSAHDSETDSKLNRQGSRPERRSRRRAMFPPSLAPQFGTDDTQDQSDAQHDAIEKAMDDQMAKMAEMHQKMREEAEARMKRARDGLADRRSSSRRPRKEDDQTRQQSNNKEEKQNSDEQDAADEEPVFEVWNSANGKYSIEAIYVRQTKDEVVLKKKNGKIINVKIESLGHDEQTRLAFRE